MEHKMASHGSLPCSSRCHKHISSSQAECSQVTKKTWMLSTHLFFLQAIHHPLYLKHHTPKKGSESSDKFPQLSPLRPKSSSIAIFHFPPLHGSNPSQLCSVFFPPFSSISLAAFRAPLWPSGSDQKLQDPYLPAKPEFQARPSRGTRGAGDKIVSPWKIMVISCWEILRFEKAGFGFFSNISMMRCMSEWEKKGAFTMLKIVLEVWGGW